MVFFFDFTTRLLLTLKGTRTEVTLRKKQKNKSQMCFKVVVSEMGGRRCAQAGKRRRGRLANKNARKVPSPSPVCNDSECANRKSNIRGHRVDNH